MNTVPTELAIAVGIFTNIALFITLMAAKAARIYKPSRATRIIAPCAVFIPWAYVVIMLVFVSVGLLLWILLAVHSWFEE